MAKRNEPVSPKNFPELTKHLTGDPRTAAGEPVTVYSWNNLNERDFIAVSLHGVLKSFLHTAGPVERAGAIVMQYVDPNTVKLWSASTVGEALRTAGEAITMAGLKPVQTDAKPKLFLPDVMVVIDGGEPMTFDLQLIAEIGAQRLNRDAYAMRDEPGKFSVHIATNTKDEGPRNKAEADDENEARRVKAHRQGQDEVRNNVLSSLDARIDAMREELSEETVTVVGSHKLNGGIHELTEFRNHIVDLYGDFPEGDDETPPKPSMVQPKVLFTPEDLDRSMRRVFDDFLERFPPRAVYVAKPLDHETEVRMATMAKANMAPLEAVQVSGHRFNLRLTMDGGPVKVIDGRLTPGQPYYGEGYTIHTGPDGEVMVDMQTDHPSWFKGKTGAGVEIVDTVFSPEDMDEFVTLFDARDDIVKTAMKLYGEQPDKDYKIVIGDVTLQAEPNASTALSDAIKEAARQHLEAEWNSTHHRIAQLAFGKDYVGRGQQCKSMPLNEFIRNMKSRSV